MSIWERLSAATRTVSVGGQISSLLGFGSTSQARKVDFEPDNEVPFTVGVIVLSAKMAKADGTVDADEVKAFKEAFKISAAEMKQVAPIFNSAKRDATNFETCAEQLVAVFNGNRKVLEDVLDGLFHIAKADEEVRQQEEQFLEKVAKRFGFTVGEFNAIKARHLDAAKRNPYDVLGVKPSISDGESNAITACSSLTTTRAACRRSLPSLPSRSVRLSKEAYDKIIKERSNPVT